MLFVIVATGNHFFFDAAAGAVVVTVAALAARVTVAEPARAGSLMLEQRMRVRGDGSRPLPQ